MITTRPRRLTPPAAPGALLKRTSPTPRPVTCEPAEDPDYLALVRLLPCLYCGVEPCGEAAHVRLASAAFGKASGLQKKPEDRWALPLCREDHLNARTAQHKRNEAEFWESLGINPCLVAEQLYKQREDWIAMHAVVIHTIMNRRKT